MSLIYWLPILVDALEEVNLALSHRRTINLNGKTALLLRAVTQCKELVNHSRRLTLERAEGEEDVKA